MKSEMRALSALLAVGLSACSAVGPDYVKPESPLGPDWYEAEHARYEVKAEQQVLWWEALGDPVLSRLITLAHQQNNSLQI